MAGQAVKLLGGFFLSGLIVFEGQAAFAVFQEQQRRHKLEARKSTNARLLKSLQHDISREESLSLSLDQEKLGHQERLERLDFDLAEARKHVEELQSVREARSAALTELNNLTHLSQQNVAKLNKDRNAQREAIKKMQQDLEISQRNLAEARRRVNPLNHPLVKDFFRS